MGDYCGHTDSFNSFVCVGVCDKKHALPGAGDGAHSVSVAGALGHTVHLTTVTVHLPHTHWPVLKTKTTFTNYIVCLNVVLEMHACAKCLHIDQWCIIIVSLVSYLCLLVCCCMVQRCVLTFAQLAKRKPFLNTSNERTVSVEDKRNENSVSVDKHPP